MSNSIARLHPTPIITAALFVVCALAITSCSGGSSAAHQGLAATYSPLHVGDLWVYDYDREPTHQVEEQLEVTGTEEIEGTTYYILRLTQEGVGLRIPFYYRTEGTRLYRYNQENSREEMVFDFQAPDMGMQRDDDKGMYVLEGLAEHTTPLGTFRNCMSILYKNEERKEEARAYYAPGIGVVEIRITGRLPFERHKTLRYAIINGTAYPDTLRK